RFLSRFKLIWCQLNAGEPVSVKVYPNMRRAREAELKALGARSVVSSHRKTSWRGEGREFESLRDYVRGDELRHISWTATARRGRLMVRQYQVERNQSIVVLLDAGRLMTSRIDQLSKLDHAINAALSIGYVATRGGDTIGDNDLHALVAQSPREISDVYRQSVAEELLQQREEALARITELGGLALDVPAGQLSFHLVNKYLEVKERGLL